MTTFADGVFQYGGLPVGGNAFGKLFSTPTKGRAWFVDTAVGTSGTGKSPKSAFSTMAQAFSNLQSGDIIYFVGKVTEQLVTPVQVFDVTIIGGGNRPRHADVTPAGGNSAASQWGPPASGAISGQATVRVLQQGWRFFNILFTMESATAAGIELVRNAASGNSERDASHAHIVGCKFAGAGIGIRSGVAGSFTELVNHAVIENNHFIDNTTAISDTIGTSRWYILNNMFNVNTNHITAKLGSSIVKGNVFSNHTTNSIVLTSGGGKNIITGNYLSGTYTTGGGYVTSNANDEWAGNTNTLTGGITVADPAA